MLKCSLCKSTFNKLFNLKRHIRKFHPDHAETLAPRKIFVCPHCSTSFPRLKELKVHKRSHSKKAPSIRKENKCPLCDYCDYQKKNLLAHFTEQHEIVLKYSHHTFPSFDEFKAWEFKNANDTKAQFVKRRKTDITKAGKTSHYVCHRSGNFISESKGFRRLKQQGSHKIDGFCPAEIKLFINRSGIYEVTFLETHVGHKNELERLFLRRTEREILANKIAQKMPFKEILNEVRDSADTSQRIHLIKRKDLHNIEQSFKLQRTSECQNDTIVYEIKDDNSILFHKAQDTINNVHPELSSEDFVLVLMNDRQKEMLNKYGSDCVCLDRICSQNEIDCELHMLSVLDDQQEGFPCAFLISNRKDEQIMTIFLFYVKQKINGAVAPRVFMSDTADYYYNAWLNVMEQPVLRFYCIWHIEDAWKLNLLRIDGKDKQDLIYNSLRAMLYETDTVAFTSLLAQFFKDIYNDLTTVNFGDYFKENYGNSAGQWAFSFRLRYDVDTNMKLEHMHNVIKKIYLSGEKVKRLDKAINAISKFVHEKCCNEIEESSVTELNELSTEPTSNVNFEVEHAYAETETYNVPEDNSDDSLYLSYFQYEDSLNEESDIVSEICMDPEVMVENDSACPSLIDQEKEDLEASMVKMIREISSLEQLKVFKALIAPIEPAMKAVAEGNMEVPNTS